MQDLTKLSAVSRRTGERPRLPWQKKEAQRRKQEWPHRRVYAIIACLAGAFGPAFCGTRCGKVGQVASEKCRSVQQEGGQPPTQGYKANYA